MGEHKKSKDDIVKEPEDESLDGKDKMVRGSILIFVIIFVIIFIIIVLIVGFIVAGISSLLPKKLKFIPFTILVIIIFCYCFNTKLDSNENEK